MTTAWEALEQLRTELAPDSPSPLQLWPEHFDLATAISDVNYGASPGDDAHPLPYLYMGPWSPPAVDGDFWNEPFGASRTISAPATTAEVLEFFREGRRHLGLPVTA
jgi:hypothetical protein